MYVYSAKNNAFYPLDWQLWYLEAGTWPADGIEVNEAVYAEFAANGPPEGKCRIAGKQGLPVWADIPPLTTEELQSRAEQEKRYRLSQAANAIAPLQYAVDLQMATKVEQASLLAWKKYCVLLNRVDCFAASDIHWPEQPT
ncbi:tail fiber assembly protein [Xenorhabdus bharatensis]|uniref:tail fiber assembly protein n=1 Tax=Xenorhabdus bharatensis TaxID=3136256 RepID=UPI0030F3FB3A